MQKPGGAWECAAMMRAEKSKPCDSADAGITANIAGETDMPCADEGCTKGARTVGILLQQS
jgi:hypothetical protein